MHVNNIEHFTAMDVQAFSLPVSKRIQIYEQKYKSCMDTQSKLSTWIQSIKEKGPPSPLREDYTPPTFKSRLTDYFSFTSSTYSTRRKRSLIPTEASDIKSSLSTLLKKTADSFSTTCKQPNNKRKSDKPKLTIRTSPPPTSQRFSLSNSFNRFSSSKNNGSISEEIIMTTPLSPTSKHRKRFSTSIVESKEPKAFHNQEHIRWKLKQPKRKPQSPPTILLPPSPTSIFLEKLHSSHAPIDYVADMVTPPSSPSSLDSPENMKQKKKRTSLLIAPSLSSIRFISQKPNFLRRQSLIV